MVLAVIKFQFIVGNLSPYKILSIPVSSIIQIEKKMKIKNKKKSTQWHLLKHQTLTLLVVFVNQKQLIKKPRISCPVNSLFVTAIREAFFAVLPAHLKSFINANKTKIRVNHYKRCCIIYQETSFLNVAIYGFQSCLVYQQKYADIICP